MPASMTCKHGIKPKWKCDICVKERYKFYNKNIRKINRKKIRISHKQWRDKNKDKIHEWGKRYKKKHEKIIKINSMYKYYLKSLMEFSCCMICFNSNPFMLETHHVFGNHSGTEICLCSNHHRILRNNKSQPKGLLLEFMNDA